MQMVKNALGRMVPSEVNGRAVKPFEGAFANMVSGKRKAAPPIPRCFPGRIDKVVNSLDGVLDRLPLRDGMCISFHHHLRNGDYLVNMVIEKLARRGFKDIVLAPTALFPVHDKLIPYIESGVISHV
ncbi:MAG TPA: citrate lyase subunit alpha, partial [Candidatus Wallbacteria bacterium]|nr:citrate lyase subunit alpha [Candidatus Wallbacteria bacterium]